MSCARYSNIWNFVEIGKTSTLNLYEKQPKGYTISLLMPHYVVLSKDNVGDLIFT